MTTEPVTTEDRARLREWAETPACPWPTDRWASVEVGMAALLDDVDRLAEECVRLESDVALVSALTEVADLRSRLACVLEASYWDRPYDERIAAIRGMCDLTTNGLTPSSDGCVHEWLDRPESDTSECLICGAERSTDATRS